MTPLIRDWLLNFIDKDDQRIIFKTDIDHISEMDLAELKKIIKDKISVYPTRAWAILVLDNLGLINIEYKEGVDSFPIAHPSFKGLWYYWSIYDNKNIQI